MALPQIDSQIKLPVFCHSFIDDLSMSLEAFRIYMHLARKWGSGKIGALGSYNDMAEHCFRGSYPTATKTTLRRKAIAAVNELTELNLLHKETRNGEDKRCLTNSYVLHDLESIVSTHQRRCQYTRVVPMHQASAIAPQEDTNIEDTISEDTLPPTPQRVQEGERVREEAKPEPEAPEENQKPNQSASAEVKPEIVTQTLDLVLDKTSAPVPLRNKYIHGAQKCDDRLNNKLFPWRNSNDHNDFKESFLEYLRLVHLPNCPSNKSKTSTKGDACIWINKREWDSQGLADIHAKLGDCDDWLAKRSPQSQQSQPPSAISDYLQNTPVFQNKPLPWFEQMAGEYLKIGALAFAQKYPWHEELYRHMEHWSPKYRSLLVQMGILQPPSANKVKLPPIKSLTA